MERVVAFSHAIFSQMEVSLRARLSYDRDFGFGMNFQFGCGG
jgi:hypothetical protein